MGQIDKVMQCTSDVDIQKLSIDKLIDDAKLESDQKYFCLINGLFNENIYPQMKSRAVLLKKYIDEEGDKKDECVYHVVIALADFMINRHNGRLNKYLPSVLYLLYVEDIVTEEFYTNWAITKVLPNYVNSFRSVNLESKFLDAAGDFTQWIEDAPYEDEDRVFSRIVDDCKGYGAIKN
jgi:hypothetical protein